MLSFLKPKQSGAELGNEFYRDLRKSHAEGFSKIQDLLPAADGIYSNAVPNEWLYLEIFTVDFSVYLALGKTPAKAAVLTPFWQNIETWLQAEQVAEMPERLRFGVVGGPNIIPAEPSESSFKRLLRRLPEYSSAITSPHQEGQNYSVAVVFASACGLIDIVSIGAVAAWFSSRKIEIVRLMRNFRIVA